MLLPVWISDRHELRSRRLRGNLMKYPEIASSKLTVSPRNDEKIRNKHMSPKFMKFYGKYMTIVGTIGNFMFLCTGS